LVAQQAVQDASTETEWPQSVLDSVSARYSVSTEALFLRLIEVSRANWDQYWRMKPEWDNAYDEARAAKKQRQNESEGGPSPYVMKVRNLGRGYVNAVLEAYQSKTITSVDAVHYLDAKYNQIHRLAEIVGR
jgi:hypothetical protein